LQNVFSVLKKKFIELFIYLICSLLVKFMIVKFHYSSWSKNYHMLLFVMALFYFSTSYATDTTGYYFMCFKYSPQKNARGNHELQLGVLHHVRENHLKYYPLGIDHSILQRQEIQTYFYYVNKAVKQKDGVQLEKEMTLLKEQNLDFAEMENTKSYYTLILPESFVPDKKFEFRKLEYFPMGMNIELVETVILDNYYFRYQLDKTYKTETSIKMLWIYVQEYIGNRKDFEDLHKVLRGMIDNSITDDTPARGYSKIIHDYPDGLFLDVTIFSVIEENNPIQSDEVKKIFRAICERQELKIVRKEYADIMDEDLTFLNNFIQSAADAHIIEYASDKFFEEQLSELFFLWLNSIIRTNRLASRFKI